MLTIVILHIVHTSIEKIRIKKKAVRECDLAFIVYIIVYNFVSYSNNNSLFYLVIKRFFSLFQGENHLSI